MRVRPAKNLISKRPSIYIYINFPNETRVFSQPVVYPSNNTSNNICIPTKISLRQGSESAAPFHGWPESSPAAA